MESNTSAIKCEPTWHGYIETTRDALLIFQACFRGILHHCARRPNDTERNDLILSGNVFIYTETSSGIKRWTDGIPWSPSRILTNFLIYRQLNTPFPSGEKKRATKKSQRPARLSEASTATTPIPSAVPSPRVATGSSDSLDQASTNSDTPSTALTPSSSSPDRDHSRGLVGSLVDSYEFKENGLLKKTMTVMYKGEHHHLVSYYSLQDARERLKTPRQDDLLKDLTLDDDLLRQSKFKVTNYDDAGDGSFEPTEAMPLAGYFLPVDQAGAGASTTPHPAVFQYPGYSPGYAYPMAAMYQAGYSAPLQSTAHGASYQANVAETSSAGSASAASTQPHPQAHFPYYYPQTMPGDYAQGYPYPNVSSARERYHPHAIPQSNEASYANAPSSHQSTNQLIPKNEET